MIGFVLLVVLRSKRKELNDNLDCKKVKKLVSVHMTDRKKGISVLLWQPEANDDIDRIVIKFPRGYTEFVMLTHLTDKVLTKHGFHVAQIMGFMEENKLWVLLIRDRR